MISFDIFYNRTFFVLAGILKIYQIGEIKKDSVSIWK